MKNQTKAEVLDACESKIRVLETKAFNNKRAQARTMRRLKEAERQVDVLTLTQPNEHRKWGKIKMRADKRLNNEAIAITLLSDVHAEEEVIPGTVNNWNKSNPDITKAKLETYANGVLKVTRELRGGVAINQLIFGMLGDMITGYLHEENLENNLLSPTEAIDFLQPLLVGMIKRFSEDGDFKQIVIPMLRGNHGRTSKRKKFSTGFKNSYEWLMYRQIYKLFSEVLVGYDNIKFEIPESEFAEIKVYDKYTTFSHGDHFNFIGGIGGLEIPLRKWGYKMQKSIPADKRYIGHWHMWMPGGREVVNGSLLGYNAYAFGKSFEPEIPMQHYELCDRNRGFTVKLPIIVDDFYKYKNA